MNAIETTAVFEGPEHLHLARPVEVPVSGEVRVIVLFQPPNGGIPQPPRRVKMPDFAAVQKEIFGDDLEARRLSLEDSAFVRDRGER